MMIWPTLMSYPQLLTPAVKEQLNTLEDLLPFEPVPPGTRSDRYVRMADWLRAAESQGLITLGEHLNLRAAIAPQL